ncbi:MAG: hypothetical protein ACYSO4_02475, partial [Planctomycetota bacterium]
KFPFVILTYPAGIRTRQEEITSRLSPCRMKSVFLKHHLQLAFPQVISPDRFNINHPGRKQFFIKQMKL